jgi:diaminopimelate epimerase
LGNDFLVALDAQNESLEPSAALARALCQRHRGIGADGMMFGLGSVEGDELEMRLFNSDGSEAEISGNGIRCFAVAVMRAQGNDSGRVVVRTKAGVRELVVTPTADPATSMVTVDMGVVAAGPAIPAALSAQELLPFPVMNVGTADVGNPHLVFEVESLEGIEIAETGPRLESLFPDGINVHFMAAKDRESIELLHWERGAGITEACGSGASVSATLAHRWGLVERSVTVTMPGGEASVTVGDTAVLTGPATHIAEILVAR